MHDRAKAHPTTTSSRPRSRKARAVWAAALAASLCVLSIPGSPVAAVAARPLGLLAPPAGYRDWKLVSVAREEGELDDIRAILGNDLAIEAYRAGTLPFPDGAIIARLAARIASFDKSALAQTKRLVNRNSLPADAEIAPEWDAFLASLGRPAAQARLRLLFERGFHEPGDVETRLGHHVGRLGPEAEARED
jgi:hypothetical protein